MKDNILKYVHTYWLPIALGILFIISYALPNIITPFAALFLGGYAVSRYIKRDFFLSIFSSTILGSTVIILMMGVLAVIYWLAHINIDLQFSFWLAIAIPVAVSYSAGNEINNGKTSFIDLLDCTALAVVVIYIAAFSFGILRNSDTPKTIDTVATQFVTFGIDDISHLTMFNDTIDANKGLLLGERNLNDISKGETATYPKMSHLIAATFGAATGLNRSSPNHSVIQTYALLKAFFFLLSIYVIGRTCLEMITATLGRDRWVAVFAALPAIGFIVFFFVEVFIQEGFFSVWPILLLPPVFLLILRKDILDKDTSPWLLVIAGSITTVVTMSWPIMGIPMYAAIGFLILRALLNKQRPATTTLAWLATALLGLVQIYVQLFDKTSTTSTSLFSATGGIPVFPLLFLLIFGVAALFAINSLGKRSQRNFDTQSYLLYISVSLAMAALIGMLNIMSTGELQYFYIKTTLLMFIGFSVLTIPLLTVWIAGAVSRSSKNVPINALVGLIVSVSICLALPLMVDAKGNIQYSLGYLLRDSRHISAPTAKLAFDNVDNDRRKDIILDVDDELESYYANAIMRGLDRFDYCRGNFESFSFQVAKNAIDGAKQNCKNKTLGIIVLDKKNVKDQMSCDEIRAHIEAIRSVGSNVQVRIIGDGQCRPS